ncbi:MAG: hypothetical protein OEW00_12215 [candidate division Zixibacteria bacterium]|nr:hypothetical protein [candidate division Zixibacteria bacterium]
MANMRRFKALALVFAFLVLFAGAFAIVSTDNVEARPPCCMWIMYCTIEPPIICWDVCVPCPPW